MDWRETWEILSFVVTVVGLPQLLEGEDPAFTAYIRRLADTAGGG